LIRIIYSFGLKYDSLFISLLQAGFLKQNTILLEGYKAESSSKYSFPEKICLAPEKSLTIQRLKQTIERLKDTVGGYE